MQQWTCFESNSTPFIVPFSLKVHIVHHLKKKKICQAASTDSELLSQKMSAHLEMSSDKRK